MVQISTSKRFNTLLDRISQKKEKSLLLLDQIIIWQQGDHSKMKFIRPITEVSVLVIKFKKRN
jgi:hypothetical protein